MPQDSLKSVVYRSFLTCEDPKGVAECKTTTKSKKSNNTQDEKQKEKASNEELQKLSCFLEVSREAERLNQVVNRPSKRMVTDLLRGSLDIQESLIMLRKFQEASKYREKSRTSADVAPKDCYDELREVIRESFARQNLLPKQRICDVDGKDSCKKKMQGSNLIAKLMGLEEVPHKATGFKQMKKENIAYQKSPFLDIDLPRPEKPLFMVEKAVKEKRTLEEIIKSMQKKGILGRKSVDGYNASFLRGDVDADGPPIVIMRPLRGHGNRDEELHHDHFNGGEHIKSRQMPRKMRGDFPPRVQLKAKEMKSKLDEGDEEKNSVRVGVRPVKKTLDCQDKLSTTKMQKKEVVARNIDKIPRLAPNASKTAETKEFKPQRSDKTQDLAKLTTVKHSRNFRENNVPKSPARSKVAASLSPTVVKKNPRKGVSNRKLSSALVKNIQSDGDFVISNETNVEETLVKNTEPEQNTEEVDKYSMSENSVNEATSSDASSPTTKDDLNVDSDQIKGCKSITNTRCLLLSSISFLNHVEDLFNFATEAQLPAAEVVHDPLLLDCSKEILERKGLHYKSMRNQWPQHLSRKTKCHLSMEELVQDICDGIEDLKMYSRSCSGVVVVDSIYPMLERDLWWKEEATGAWDSGWRRGYTAEAVDEVMHDVEELVFSEIVDDASLELCCGDFGL